MLNLSPESERQMWFERVGGDSWALHLRGFQHQWYQWGKASPVRTRKQRGHILEKAEEEANFLVCENGHYRGHSEKHQKGNLRDCLIQPTAIG